jgi:hypothetical protein
MVEAEVTTNNPYFLRRANGRLQCVLRDRKPRVATR